MNKELPGIMYYCDFGKQGYRWMKDPSLAIDYITYLRQPDDFVLMTREEAVNEMQKHWNKPLGELLIDEPKVTNAILSTIYYRTEEELYVDRDKE